MFTRSAAPGGLFITTVLACLLAATAAATEWHIGAGGSGSNYFATLEEFREAMAAGLINMADGDAILLYRDDASLTADLVLPDAWHITIRSVGGQYTISGGSIWSTVDAVGNNPNLTLENVRISSVGYAAINFEAVNSGHLTVSNSAVVDGTIGLNIEGNVTADIINSQFSNNAYINVASVSNYSLESTTLNITMNANADRRTIWSGGSTAISFFGSGNFDINFDVAAGKVLDVQGSIDAANYGFRSMNITKTGAGEVKLRGGSVLWDPDLSDDFYYTYGNFNFVLEEGKVHFTSTGKTDTTWTDFNGSITTKSGTVFKINHTPGTLADIPESDDIVVGENWVDYSRSYFYLNTFNAEEGTKLEIGGISLWPRYVDSDRERYSFYLPFISLGDVQGSSIAKSMNIDNDLLKATVEFGALNNGWNEASRENWDGIYIYLEKVEDLSSLDGVGEYADVYRMLDTLSDEERDFLDSVYARGGLDRSSRAYFQTMSGAIVTNSILAMQHNWRNLTRKINRRITSFQHEELEELTVSGSDFCRYDRNNVVTDYLELWADIDQSWMRQNDNDSLAAYRYQHHGINIGIDRHVENVIYGGVLRYDDGTMKLRSNSRTKTDIDTLMGALYYSWANEAYYITGSAYAGYGWNESWSNYNMPGIASYTATTGTYGTSIYGALVEGGYMMESEVWEDLTLRATPYGSLGYARLHRQATNESGGGSLNRHFRRNDWDMWEFTIGTRFALPVDRGTYMLIPSADIAFSRTMGDPRNKNGDVQFLESADASWRVNTVGSSRSALRLSAGLNAHFYRNMDVGASYDFEWRSKFTSHQLNMNFSLGF